MVKPTLSRLLLGLVLSTFCNLNTISAGVVYSKTFQGEEQEIGIMLKWSTSAEDNNSMFIIEKAEDGENFESVGAVGGAGSSNELIEYNYFDFDIHGTYILYRLKQIDFDGAISFSKPLFITKLNENNFLVAKLSDVMTYDNFEVTIDMMINSNFEYHLINSKGETVLNESMHLKKGINDIIIDMENAEVGTYKLVLKVKEEEEVLTFRKVYNALQKDKSVTVKGD